MESSEHIILSSEDKNNFIETAKWTKFLAVIGFIFSGIMILTGFVMMVTSFNTLPIAPIFLGVIYLGLSALYVVPCIYLITFSRKITSAIRSNSQTDFTKAILNLKKLYVFFGIITAIILILYAFIFIFGILGGLIGGNL